MIKSVLKIFIFFSILFLIGNFIIKNVSKIDYGFEEARVSTPFSLLEDSKILNSLTIEQKIGQLFIIGFDGKVLTPEVEKLIRELHPGGVLLLKRNIENEEQLRELIKSLQKIAIEDTGLPLFVTVDQEGGLISRIDWIEKTAQFAITNEEQAYQIGLERGKKLKELGINLNLAPLLDITIQQDFIFERSFQKTPEIIGEIGKALVRGQKDSGIFTSIKHFPGYGRIDFNPEEQLAVLEIIPEFSQFQEVAQSHPEMVMISNVVYKELDNKLPFSFLSEGIDLLKQEINGNYLIVSDDLDQNSLLRLFSLREIVVLPFNAGNDILIFSGWRLPSIKGVIEFRKAVEENEISLKRIDRSVLKIINLKQRYIN